MADLLLFELLSISTVVHVTNVAVRIKIMSQVRSVDFQQRTMMKYRCLNFTLLFLSSLKVYNLKIKLCLNVVFLKPVLISGVCTTPAGCGKN